MHKIVITSVTLLVSLLGFTQDLKLGLPVGHTNGLNSAVFSPDGTKILTSSSDGSTILWDVASGEQLIQSFIFDEDPNKWVHLHPSGLFDTSPEGMALMYWTKGLEVINFEQLKDRYWEPGLWEKVMRGDAP